MLEQDLLAKNDLLAARNRGWLEGRSIRALNVMSSPGAGKTTLLVRTLQELGDRLRAGVIEGGQETSLDADRIRALARPLTLLRELCSDGMTVLLSTHHPDHALYLADRVVLMGGSGPTTGTAEELLTARELSALYGVPVSTLLYSDGDTQQRTIVVHYGGL
ncbi:hypothetical protein ACWF5H_14715 [Arthrobacter sp. NPDC055138]